MMYRLPGKFISTYASREDTMRRRAVRITPLGYIVLSIIILVMLVGIYFIVWSMRNSDNTSAGHSTAKPANVQKTRPAQAGSRAAWVSGTASPLVQEQKVVHRPQKVQGHLARANVAHTTPANAQV